MIYEHETALIRKGLFAIQNQVGLGHRGAICHNAMVLWLPEKDIAANFGKQEAHIHAFHAAHSIGGTALPSAG